MIVRDLRCPKDWGFYPWSGCQPREGFEQKSDVIYIFQPSFWLLCGE